jgi:hypothetical protein
LYRGARRESIEAGDPEKNKLFRNGRIMFYSKKPRSWYMLAMWALVFAGFLYSISRFFLHAVDKEARGRRPPKNASNASKGSWEELFV